MKLFQLKKKSPPVIKGFKNIVVISKPSPRAQKKKKRTQKRSGPVETDPSSVPALSMSQRLLGSGMAFVAPHLFGHIALCTS